MNAKSNRILPFDQATWPLVRRLFRDGVRPHLGRLAVAVLCMALAAGATAASAWLMEPTLDQVFLKRNAAMLWPVGLAVLTVFAIKGVATYGQAVLINHIGQRIVADYQDRLFRHVIHLDVGFFHEMPPGTLISRFTHDANTLRLAVSKTLTGFGGDTLKLVFLIGLIFYQDWQLAIIAFFVFPAAVLPIVQLGRRMRRVSENTQEEMARLSNRLKETFEGVRHVKAYGMESYEAGRVRRSVDAIFGLIQRAVRVRSAAHPIMETLGGAAIASVILYGGFRVIEGDTSPGTFFSFITALLMAYQPLKNLANLNANLQEGLAAAQRLFAIQDLQAAIVDAPDATPLTVREGAIRFEAVGFAYHPGAAVLNDLTLDVVPGGKTALVGPSGAGKSTILNLIPRFFDPDTGRVLIDGQDISAVTLASLRGAIGLVSQETALFDDTVRANIAYGRPDATDAEVAEAARLASADDFIAALPDGYETEVGSHGAKLSGGQRQRLVIARAILKNAPILLLDEATSALDSESELRVQAALNNLMRDRTTVVIAHRLSTVLNADIIHVIEAGRILESGRHSELLERGGAYARLYALQFASDTAEDEAGAPGIAAGVHG